MGEELYRNVKMQKQVLTACDTVNPLAHECRYHSGRFLVRPQNVSQAALQSASQRVRPSLLDFLS